MEFTLRIFEQIKRELFMLNNFRNKTEQWKINAGEWKSILGKLHLIFSS